MKLIILDRDGTINEDRDDFVKSAEEWVPLPGALEAIARLNQGGWHVVVASNQSGLGRGLFDLAALNAMHAKMHKLLAAHGGKIDAIFYCPHTPEDACHCRKPQPGLFEQILDRYGIDLSPNPDASTTPVHAAGDSLRDLLAGAAVGCVPHLVLTGKGAIYRQQALAPEFPPQTQVHADLAAFAENLLQSA